MKNGRKYDNYPNMKQEASNGELKEIITDGYTFWYKDEDGIVWQLIKTPYNEIPLIKVDFKRFASFVPKAIEYYKKQFKSEERKMQDDLKEIKELKSFLYHEHYITGGYIDSLNNLATALQSYMRKRVDLLELANKNANAALADKCDEFGRYVKDSERKVLEGRIDELKHINKILKRTAYIQNASNKAKMSMIKGWICCWNIKIKELEQQLKAEEGVG